MTGNILQFSSRQTSEPAIVTRDSAHPGWSIDQIGKTVNGNVWIEACIATQVLDSLLLLIQYNYVVVPTECGGLALEKGLSRDD